MALSAVQRLARALCQSGTSENSPSWPCERHCRQAEALVVDILRDQGVEPTEPVVAVPGLHTA